MKIIVEDIPAPTVAGYTAVLSLVTSKGRFEEFSSDGGTLQIELPDGASLLSASVGNRFVGEPNAPPSGAMIQERMKDQDN